MAEVQTIDPNSVLVSENLANPVTQQDMPETGLTATTSAQADVPAGEAYATPTALGLDATFYASLSMAIVIAIMLWKKVPAAIGRALDKKIAGIREQLDEAKKLRAEAEALKAEYEAKAAAASAEAATMLERAQQEADGIVRQAEADTAALIERRTRMAEEKISAAERAAIDSVRARVATAAAAAAEKLIAERHDPAADKAMVDRTISGLGALN